MTKTNATWTRYITRLAARTGRPAATLDAEEFARIAAVGARARGR